MKAKRMILLTMTIIAMMVIALTTVMSVSAQVTESTPSVNVTEPTITPTEAPDPSIPHITSTENTRTGIKIKWSGVDGASKYRVFVKSGSKWKKIGDTSKKYLTYETDKNNKTYTFTVRCITSNGKKYTSSYDKTGFKATFFAVPKLKSVSNTTTGVKFTWNAVDGIDKYRVFVKRAGADSWTNKGIVDSTSYTHTSGVSGRKYVYTVRCVKDDKTVSSFNSSGKSITYVASPNVTNIENTSSGAKLTWKKCNGAYKYRVFVKSGSNWKKIADTKSTSFTHTDAQNNKKYTYTVRCCNSDSKYVSAYNKDGYTATYYKAPSLKKVSNTTTGVKFTWNAVDGISEYRVFVKTNDSSWVEKADVAGTSYSDTSVESGNKYTYTVKCIKDNEVVSSYDSKGKSTTFISAPIITSATLDKNNNIKLSWDTVNGAYKYRVLVKSGSEWKKLSDTTNTTYTVKNVATNKDLTYTVRCLNTDGEYTSDYNKTGFTVKVEYIIDQEAYNEEIPLYEERVRGICNKCGKDLADELIPEDSEYYGWDGYKYHILIDGCQSAWHTEYRWFVIADNKEATQEQIADITNIYLYNENHNDKLEYRYLYSAICRVSDCEYNLEHPLYSCIVKSKDEELKKQLQILLDEHAKEHEIAGERTDGNVAVQKLVYQLIDHPEIGHYELTIK